jgi:hypothetical protein
MPLDRRTMVPAVGGDSSQRRDTPIYRFLRWNYDSAIETTAQVDPAAFTGGIMRAPLSQGARVLMSAVTSLPFSNGGATVRGVMVDGRQDGV